MGGDVTLHHVSRNLRDSYGRPVSWHIFLRASALPRYGEASPWTLDSGPWTKYVIYVLTFVDVNNNLLLLTHVVSLYREWLRDQARRHHSNQAPSPRC